MGLFDIFKNLAGIKADNHGKLFKDIIRRLQQECKKKDINFWSFNPLESDTYQEVLFPLPDKQKIAFIIYAATSVSAFYASAKSFSSDDNNYQQANIANTLFRHLLKLKMQFDEEDISILTNIFINTNLYSHKNLFNWPIGLFITQLDRVVKEKGISTTIQQSLQQLKKAVEAVEHHQEEKAKAKLTERIEAILFASANSATTVKPVYFPGADEFADNANNTLKSFTGTEQQLWFKLMALALKTSGAKPSKKLLDESKEICKELNTDKFKKTVTGWMEFITKLKEKETQHTYTYGNGQQHTYTNYEFIAPPNLDIMKGLVWMCVHFHDKNTLLNTALLVDRCFKKIPGKGPAAASLGNACLYVLANSKGLDGVGHLSRLKLRIKQNNTQNLIDKYLSEAAEKQGVTIHEIEDMAVDDYDLVEGKRDYEFDGYKAIVEITGAGKSTVNWFKPDGTPQKAIPAFVKEKYAAKLKRIKDTIKQIDLSTGAQRDRMDRMLKSNRTLTTQSFHEFYLQHGLMSWITKKIVWVIQTADEKTSAYYHNGNWINNKGDICFTQLPADAVISLWHPVFETVEAVKAWRECMLDKKITQPVKQVFREVYILTDAEINTRTYSNRMAAHILKQHQFNSLAKSRGWKYSLLGAFDNGVEHGIAEIYLSDYNLKAEYWINEVNADDAMNDTGIWLYVATDQVRFINTLTSQVLELIEVPRLALSEVMRDVDLFVGVASVGNDPNWRDGGGLPAYRDYWQSYSFGDLTEVAKTRKEILEKLLPRLKISTVATIRDKFVVVTGKLRTYKIHIGSTNILMEPNDQYLCIVQDRGKKDIPDNTFIPFEGDSGLSVILSKAILLADDDQITDDTITRQINYK